jgi:hypothetical protein
MQERANLLEEIEKKTLPSILTTDNESQTDDREHEKMVQVNNKLKHVLQVFKDKIHRVVAERPDLFDGIGEETSERLDHLISTIGNQATQIDALQAECDEVEEQLRDEIKQLQRYVTEDFSLELFLNIIALWKQVKTNLRMNVE